MLHVFIFFIFELIVFEHIVVNLQSASIQQDKAYLIVVSLFGSFGLISRISTPLLGLSKFDSPFGKVCHIYLSDSCSSNSEFGYAASILFLIIVVVKK